jgi:hypothetical protein
VSERHQQLIAYLATLGTLLLVFIAALVASGAGVNVTEAFGLGTITGGLIGVLRLPTQRNVTVDNAADDPVPTTKGKP